MFLDKPRQLTNEDMISIGIPRKYWNSCIFSIKVTNASKDIAKILIDYLRNMKIHYNSGTGLILYEAGNNEHLGKTSICISILKLFAAHSVDTKYISFEELYDLKKANENISTYLLTEVLAIDDISNINRYQEKFIEFILEKRTSALKTTILILGNTSIAELSEKSWSLFNKHFIELNIRGIEFTC